MSASDSSAARRFAEWGAGAAWREVPAEQAALVPLRVLDTIGLIFAGLETDAAAAARAVARAQGDASESLAIGGAVGDHRRLAAASAALAHATIAHCRDFDDTFPDSVVHPGSTVVAVALAVGEAAAASAEEIALSIVIGYEVAARLGSVGERRFHARGFHASGIVGPVAAAATAARLYRLDADRTTDALGLACSMSGGLMAFMADGAWSKWLHTGWSAHGGVIAAQLAREGFRGPGSAIDGPHGLFAAFLHGEEVRLDPLTRDLGASWRGGEAQFKYYPCAHVIHPYIDAALQLVRREAIGPQDIEAVECAIAPWAARIVCLPREPKLRPANALEAIASLPYQIAVAFAEGRVDLGALDDAMRTRQDVLALAERVRHREDPALGSGFDGVFELRTLDGRNFSIPVRSAAVDPDRVLGKFRANMRRAGRSDQTAPIEGAVMAGALPDFAGLREFLG